MSELFLKPEENKFPNFSVSSVNQVIRNTNRLITGDGVQLKKLGDRFIIESRPDFVRDDPNLRNVVVLEEHEDYLLCVFFDFTYNPQEYDEELGITLQQLGETAVPILVAKPYWLQVTPFASTPYEHTGSINPAYMAGDIIVAWRKPTQLSVDGVPVEWSDINTAGRNRGVSSGGSGVSLGMSSGVITGRTITTTSVANLTGSFNIGVSVVPISFTGGLPVNTPFNAIIDSEEMTLIFDGVTVTALCRGANDTTEANHSSMATIYRKRVTLGTGTVRLLKATIQQDSAYDIIDECDTRTVYNPCTAIPNRTLVQVWPESLSGRLIATALCTVPADIPLPDPDFCEGCPSCFMVSFTGLTNSGCSGCVTSAALVVYLDQLSSCEYYYNSASCYGDPDCFDLCGWNYTIVRFYKSGVNEWTLLIDDGGGTTAVPIIAKYTADTTGWNCTDPLVMNRILPDDSGPDESGYCQTWPATVTIEPCGAVPGGVPTVAFASEEICRDVTTVTITGTNFETGIPGNNLVTFNLGATGTCTAATSTELTVTFITHPTSIGALTAIVNNANGSSGVAVQIATVIDCPPTVEFFDFDICQDDELITIAGTHFESIFGGGLPGNNLVTFNLGAAGTVTSGDPTTLVVTFTTNPTSTGALTAIVTNANGTSGAAVQVATVIECGEPGTIETSCCENLLPEVLYGTFSGGTGDCACVNGVTVELIYDVLSDPSAPTWVLLEDTLIGECEFAVTADYNIQCVDGEWSQSSSFGACPSAVLFSPPTEVSCDPLELTCSITLATCGSGCGTATLTITSEPP